MKCFKKLLAVMLSIAMVLGMFTVTAYAGSKKIDTSGTYNMTENYFGTSGVALSVGWSTANIDVTVNAGSYQIYNNDNSKNAVRTKATTLTINSPNKMIYNYASETEKYDNATIYVSAGTLTIGAGTTVARVDSSDTTTPLDGKTVIYIANATAVHLDGAIIAGKIAGSTIKIAKDITSGYFYGDMSAYCATGYECVALSAEQEAAHPGCHYTVLKKAVAMIGDARYYELGKALAAVADGEVLTLMQDATDTFTFPEEEKVFTFDKNGKNYDFGNLKAPDGYVLHVIDNENDTFQIGIDRIEEAKIKEDGITLAGTLSDTLGMKYYVEYYLPKGADVPVFVFTNPMTGEDETIEGVATDIYGKYSYEIKGIYMNYIADVFGWSIMDGEKELKNSTASILGYYEELANVVTDEVTLTLLDNTIRYAYELQKYGKKGAEFDINALGEWATAHATDIEPLKEGTIMGRGGAMKTCFASISLYVTDKIAMAFNMENVPAGYTIALYDKNGHVVQLKGKDDNYYYKLEVGEKTLSKWSVVSASISPDEYGDTFALELFDTEGKLVGWAVYNVNTYCFNMRDAIEGKNPVGYVARAIYNYGTAFVAYQKA